ncbi:MAG: tRNA lysidine(34) synthetase TilS [Alphaproteobacteria bacterium]|nr:tRNA lysidine(34) synthetase TilS [Alphaproteobacteria bacterium]MBU4137053.1 tRNA lysidine(34) synthetase TilS [Alphaproteobacteria bacterium]
METGVDRPLALALSGGGDSLALLRLAADWAKANGRRLLALTVDHGLSPASAGWTDFAERAARAAGADWRGLAWTGPKPASGLPAAARTARHRLIAAAARAAGARVVLFAHTADDIAEGEVMRAEGSTLGRLRDWSPSPVWPEGRGLMLLRPMLGARRTQVRDWLAGQGADWIDDPGNEDVRFARSRARQLLTLLPSGEGGARPAPAGWEDEGLRRQGARPPDPLTPSRKDGGCAAVRSSPLPTGAGWFHIDRSIDASTLAAVLVCVGGGGRLPRGDRLDSILSRLLSREDFTATLCGARIEATGDSVLVTREAGEFARRPRPPLPLGPGVETVWDGRWAVTVDSPGWSVAPAAGRMAALSDADRAALKALPAAMRGALPVLIRNDATAPVLAGTAAKATSLVEERLALALDRMTHERDLGGVFHGASPRNHLFSA